MNKKIIIGSIMSVIFLILTSFPSVIASQSITQSDVFSKIKLMKNNPVQIQDFLKDISSKSQTLSILQLIKIILIIAVLFSAYVIILGILIFIATILHGPGPM